MWLAAMSPYVLDRNINNVFFFQAEDGIRDLIVTGVQTCALPISIGVEDEVVPAIGRKHCAAEQSRLPAAGPDAPAAGALEVALMSEVILGTAHRVTELEVQSLR